MAQVNSGSFGTTYYSNRNMVFSWSLVSQSIENNTSTINWSFVGGGSATTWFYTKNGYLNIDGARRWTQTSDIQLSNGTVMASGTLTLTHNSDGKRSFSADGGATIFSYGTYQSGSGSWELPQIPRAATLTNAPNFNDEENPTIAYQNLAGESVESLQACIANSTGTTVYADYRAISKTGSSYTFELTDEERNNLRWASINSPNLTVKFYVTTMIGGKRYESTLDKIMTITNATPTLEANAYDNGNTSLKLTGDNNKMIKGFNYIVATQTATSYKGSTIKKQTITNGETTHEGNSANFSNVESNVFTFTATDSRGFTTTKTITKELIDYKKLTCNLKINSINAVGDCSFKISGNYFNGSFGATDNTLNVYYRYKKEDENYTSWIEVQPTITKDTYEVNVDLLGLDYKSVYTVQAKASDKVNTNILSVERKIIAVPIFDWGKNDFNINGDLTIKGVDAKKVLGGTINAIDEFSGDGLTGNIGVEYAKVIITPQASVATQQVVYFKKTYKKPPVVVVACSTGAIGTNVLGASIVGIATDYVTIALFRTNVVPTGVHLLVVGEVEE